MKKFVFFLVPVLFATGCANKKNTPDISSVKVNVAVERFDQDLFAVDTLDLQRSIPPLQAKYPVLLPIFVKNILGLDSTNFVPGIKEFLRLTQPIQDSAAMVFKEAGFIKNDFEKAFRFVKYYFPDYQLPKIITVLGPVYALAQTSNGYSPDFLGPDFLGISLQFYLGNDFSVYKNPNFIAEVAPAFRSRRFSKEYIVSDAMQLIVDDLFPDKSNTRPLIEQIIEKGKQWWLLDKFLPEVSDSLKTGYTRQQLEWCVANEGLIWSYIIKNEDLYSINNATIQTYIGEGPFTQVFSHELSPGNIGPWIGWQIVKKYAENNPGKSPAVIMQASAKQVLEEAKYKPK